MYTEPHDAPGNFGLDMTEMTEALVDSRRPRCANLSDVEAEELYATTLTGLIHARPALTIPQMRSLCWSFVNRIDDTVGINKGGEPF